jgi:ligand-binding sensor domain-containing protein
LKNSRTLTGAAGILLLAASLRAAPWDWKTFTSTMQFRGMVRADSTLWCATEGGLLSFNAAAGSFRTTTNTEGLASNEMTAIAGDGSGTLWLGFKNGVVQRFEPASGKWSTFEDFKGHPIECLRIRGDSLFVGMDIGLSLFLVSRLEVKETYRRLGSAFQTEVPVRDVALHAGRIWAAVDKGLAHAALGDNNLLDPAHWTDVTFPDPVGEISCLAVWNGRIALGCARGVYLQNAEGWDLLSAGYPNAAPSQLAGGDDGLLAATPYGLFAWNGSAWNREIQGPDACMSLVVEGPGIWVGTAKGLWGRPDPAEPPVHYIPNCPSDSRFVGMAVDLDGTLWGASDFASGSGFYGFNGREWLNYNTANHPEIGSNDMGCVAVDNLNRKWFGTWGNGALLMENDSSFRQYNPPNGFLSGSTSVNRDYAAVYDIAVEPSGTVWILNTDAISGRPLVAVTDDTVWTYYTLPNGIRSVRTVAFDGENRKWIGTLTNGVLIMDDAGTPWDPTDDPDFQQITTADGLTSNVITALAVDQDGTVWIGTNDGLYYYSFGSLRQINVYYQDAITALMVDGVNNVWVGTNIGAGFFSTSTYASTHFTAASSPLVSDQITSLACDPRTGAVYIGTGKGLSRVETPFSKNVPELRDLSLYPNPFLPERAGTLTIDGLAKSTSVCVYTQNGFLVRRFPAGGATGRSVTWDGKNDQGQSVSGGIYLVVARTAEGRQSIGKIALVR